MGESEHNYDEVYGIEEGDEVTLVTTGGDEFDVTCTERKNRHPQDPADTSEYDIWTFDHNGRTLKAQVTQGLKSHDWEAEYPRSLPLYDPDEADEESTESYGYIVEVND